jgi:hypothetical protein
VRYALERPHHYQLIFGDTPMSQPPAEIEAAADDGLLALRELVQSAQAQNDLVAGSPRELATIIWVLLHGLAHLRLTGHLHEPRAIDGDTHLEDLLTMTLEALRPATASGGTAPAPKDSEACAVSVPKSSRGACQCGIATR